MQSKLEIAHYRHGRVPREVRERQVLTLAEELFAERGFAGASMDELARRAGVSKPVIYDLVGSKDELYRRLFERAADELAEQVAGAIAPDAEPLARLEAGLLAFFRFIESHRQGYEMLFREDAGGRAEAAVGGMRARQNALVSAMLQGLAGGGADAERLQAAAHMLNGSSEALAAWWRDHPEPAPETLARWVVELVGPGLTALIEGRVPGR